MPSLQDRLTTLTQAIAGDVKTLLANQGSLPALDTTAKGSLVLAINELQAEVLAATGGGATINDTATAGNTTSAWSANKIFNELAATKASILGGASPAYDTLVELQGELQNQDSAVASILTALGFRVRFDVAQTLTVLEQAQANTNMASASLVQIGNPDTDLVAIYNTAKV